MHKQDASQLFAVLGNEDTVKMAKMLFNRGAMNYDTLHQVITQDEEALKKALTMMQECGLVFLDNDMYQINKPLLDELLSFIVTPCGCTRK